MLTGAGASMPLGLPATKGFLDHCRERLLGQVLDQPPGYDRFVQERLLSARNTDIEVLLGDLEAHASWAEQLMADDAFTRNVLRGDTRPLADFKQMTDQLREAIYDEVIAVYGNVDPDQAAVLYQGLLGHYMLFFRPFCGGRETLPFFTLNYDTAIEEATSRLGIRRVDGIVDTPGSPSRHWDAMAYTGYELSGQELSVVLVKLHGSVRLVERKTSAGSVFVEVPASLARNPRPLTHVVLYPSLLPKPITTEPFRTGYRMLAACLSSRHTYCLVVIGCSFRDAELNALLRNAIDDNDQLRLVVIDPCLTHELVAERIGCSPERIGVLQTTFEPEDPDTLKAGQGRVLGPLRNWVGAALKVQSPSRFGTTEAVD